MGLMNLVLGDGKKNMKATQKKKKKMIKGSFLAPGKNGKTRKQRPITSIKKDLDYNERLWAVAEQFIPVPVAA